MSIRTKQTIIQDDIREEIQLSESRKIAKDMACRRECGELAPDVLKVAHVIACPYWEPKQ